MNTIIRPATSDDVETLVALAERTIRVDYAHFFGAEAVDAYIATGGVEAFVRESVPRCVVIGLDERLAGLCVMKGTLIELMMIDHDLQGRGLGTELLAHCEGQLFRDHAELVLESFAPNERANRFYRKNGWHEVDRQFDPESGVDKIEFRKRRGADT